MERGSAVPESFGPVEGLLAISAATDAFALVLAGALKARFPDMDVEGWLPDIRREMFEAAKDVGAGVAFAHGAEMA